MRTAIILLLFAASASGGTTIERILPVPIDMIPIVEALNDDPNLPLCEIIQADGYPHHRFVHVTLTDVKRNNDPNRHELYYHQAAWDEYILQVGRGVPAAFNIAAYQSWYGNLWVVADGYEVDYEPSRYPQTVRYAWIWLDGEHVRIYFRGACGNEAAPHPCENGIAVILTWKTIPRYWHFARHWLGRDCEWPVWCGRCDLDFDGVVDLRDLGILQEAR